MGRTAAEGFVRQMRAVALVFSLHAAVFSLQSTVAYSYIDSLTKAITHAKTWTYTCVVCFFSLAALCMVLLCLVCCLLLYYGQPGGMEQAAAKARCSLRRHMRHMLRRHMLHAAWVPREAVGRGRQVTARLWQRLNSGERPRMGCLDHRHTCITHM